MFKVFKLKKILKIVFLIYIIFLLYILFLKCEYRVKSSFEFLSKEHIKYCTNLKPLNTVKRYIRGFINHNVSISLLLENLLGNFILFVPMSFFIIYFFKEISFFKYIICLILVIILIELIQFAFIIGVADIDDVILNFSGAVFSYILIKNVLKKNFF